MPLTINTNVAAVSTNSAFATGGVETSGTGVSLSTMIVSFFIQTLGNTVTIRAKNRGVLSRINFAYEQSKRSILDATNCRTMDVDIAAESTSLTKYNTVVQPSASISPQANNSPNVTLKLLG
jgi:flagellin-like hook-associated protein FlgL